MPSRTWIMLLTTLVAGAFAAGTHVLSEGDLLVEAAGTGNLRTVERLLRDGAAIEQRDWRGRTALLAATHGNHIDTARVLIAAGADVNAKDAIEDSPYLYAGARGHQQILELTLAHGADLRSTNRYGGTALIPACERGHLDTVRTLIEAGVNIDHVNRLGWTALLETVILGNGDARYQAITRLLLQAGADPNLADREGVTPLAHARNAGHAEIAALLEAAAGITDRARPRPSHPDPSPHIHRSSVP